MLWVITATMSFFFECLRSPDVQFPIMQRGFSIRKTDASVIYIDEQTRGTDYRLNVCGEKTRKIYKKKCALGKKGIMSKEKIIEMSYYFLGYCTCVQKLIPGDFMRLQESCLIMT